MVNAVLLKIPVLQSHWSTAVSACRNSIAKLLEHSHFQVDTTALFQKSWRSLQNLLTDIIVLVKETVSCANMDTCYLARKNVDFSDSLLSHPGKGRCHILRNATLGNAVESHPAARSEQCRKHKALAPRVGTN